MYNKFIFNCLNVMLKWDNYYCNSNNLNANILFLIYILNLPSCFLLILPVISSILDYFYVLIIFSIYIYLINHIILLTFIIYFKIIIE